MRELSILLLAVGLIGCAATEPEPTFGPDGAVIAGSAKHGIELFPVEEVEGKLIVRLER